MVDCCLDLAANRQGSSSAGYGQKPKLPQPAAAVGGNNNSSTTAHTTFGGTFVYWANKATSILFNQAEMCTKLRLNCATTKDATLLSSHPVSLVECATHFNTHKTGHKTLIMKLVKMKNFRYSFG